MQIYDVSLTLSPALPVWPGDPTIQLERVARIEDGAEANVTHIDMNAHVGTHVDAPYHFLGDGYPTVESLPLNILTGRAYVVNVPENIPEITADVLESLNIPSRTRRLLLRTRNSAYWTSGVKEFQTDFVGLSGDGAQYIVDKGIRLVGIDYLSIAPYHNVRPTHEILLKKGVIVIEGLDLSRVTTGRYAIYCLPLKLAGSDGAPARVILIGV